VIEKHGYGTGKYCNGTLEEAVPCAQGISHDLINWASPNLYLSLNHVTENNLGGKGPNYQATKSLRFQGVAQDNSQTVDLLVTAEDGYDSSQGMTYNGQQGQFGNIFLARDSEATLHFQLVDSTTSEPVAANDFVLKFFDNDEGVDGSDEQTYDITADTVCEEFYTSHDTVWQVDSTCATPDPTTFTKPFVVDAGCEIGGYSHLNLGNVVNSNLLGKGPDYGKPQNLHFSNVLNVDGQQTDMILEVAPGSEYEPGNAKENGNVGGTTGFSSGSKMGTINQMPGGVSKFVVKFVDGSGAAVYVPRLNLTFFDIDMPRADLRERILVNGYIKKFFLDPQGQEKESNNVAYQKKSNGGEFSSATLQVPEPTDPDSLTSEQADVAVTLFFEDVHQFTMELEVTWISNVDQNADHTSGQVFYFGGSACTGALPEGHARRLQVFTFPWSTSGTAAADPTVAPAAPHQPAAPVQHTATAAPIQQQQVHPVQSSAQASSHAGKIT